ncbi:hypothetical protein [Hydrogenophaga sp.]|uniref:hypothetical protein n=1 Tax=Hydrogenophaga sp. TaxID=1904254 RepID=UPI0027321F89|nr:hypothetical protein [Hydrogenophaga sp.]MDP2074601.1 hypothetical protein [Hydrogenophaga sp.]MDP3106430.1 hypothetical protein [Hydrogenophaga sp.]
MTDKVQEIMSLVHKFSVASTQGNAVSAMRLCAEIEAKLVEVVAPPVPEGWKLVPANPTMDVRKHLEGKVGVDFLLAYADWCRPTEATTPQPASEPDLSNLNADDRYRFLLGFLIEKGVLTNKRYDNGTWILRGVYGVDDSGLKGAGRTPEEALDNAIIAAQLDPVAAGKFWQDTHAALASTTAQSEPMAREVQPVHWRALLDPAQRPHKLQMHHHVVGFTSLKACEAFVAGELDMNGWRYTIEPLYATPQPAAKPARAEPVARDGWVMVPVEPTPKMLVAMWDHREAMRGQSENRIARAGYAALLAASPTQPRPKALTDEQIMEIQQQVMTDWMKSDRTVYGWTLLARAIEEAHGITAQEPTE